MHFDDRLGTVLRIRADGEGMRRIQLRQLIDLLGTAAAEARGDQLDAAFVRLGELTGTLSEAHTAAILAEPGVRLRSPRLVATLAAAPPAVARAALGRAELDEEQWLDLLPALPPPARGYLRERGDLPAGLATRLARLGVHDRALPPAAAVVAEPEAPPPASGDIHGIGALVRRIEAYRQARATGDHPPAGGSPRLPLDREGEEIAANRVPRFDFATDAAGAIVWADTAVLPMVLGLRLAARDGSSGLAAPAALGEALRARQPLRAMAVTIAGAPAIAGAWQLDAAPWFDPLGGRLIGWRGRMRRPAEPGAPRPAPLPPVARDSEADRIRQLLHELRTPINAIQGFAEVIQQQLFGPTPHDYRALAASIVGDAARMLSAFDELERLAKLDSAALELEPGETDAGEVFAQTAAQLDAHIRQREGSLTLRVGDGPFAVALARVEVERLAWRIMATLAGTCAPGEALKARLRARDGTVRLDLALPAVLAGCEGEALFRASAGDVPQAIAAGVFGVGFALRLARAEARAAGGTLVRKGERLRLILPAAGQPGLTTPAPGHNHEGSAG